jgi:hypothetical protein
MSIENMTTLQRALSDYEIGRLTSTGLMLESLQIIDSGNVDSVLAALPSGVVETLARFVQGYHRDIRVFNGPKPSEESVRIAKEWLAEHAAVPNKAHIWVASASGLVSL